MKKKVLLISALSSVLAVSALVGGLAFSRGNFELVEASDKVFTYNVDVGANQFAGEDYGIIVERSVVTGFSSNIETVVSLIDEGYVERAKSFGNNGQFVEMAGGLTAPMFTVEIGLNNVQGVTVHYGLYATSEYTTADQVGCSIRIYDEDNGYIDGNASCGTGNMNTDASLTWTKSAEEEKIGTRIVIEVWSPSGFVYYQDPLFIRTIAVNWSC